MSYKLLLGGAFVLEAAGYVAFPFVAIQLREQFKLNEAAIGTLLMLAIALRPLWAVAGGYWSERVRSLYIVAVACLAESASFLLLASAHSVSTALYALVLGNLGFALWTPNLFTLVYRWYPETDARRRVALMTGVLNAGGAAGCLLGSVFVASNRAAVFWSAGIMYLAVMPILVFLLSSEKNTIAATADSYRPKGCDGIGPWVMLVFACFGFWASYAQFVGFFSLFASDWLQHQALVGIAFAVVIIPRHAGLCRSLFFDLPRGSLGATGSTPPGAHAEFQFCRA